MQGKLGHTQSKSDHYAVFSHRHTNSPFNASFDRTEMASDSEISKNVLKKSYIFISNVNMCLSGFEPDKKNAKKVHPKTIINKTQTSLSKCADSRETSLLAYTTY